MKNIITKNVTLKEFLESNFILNSTSYDLTRRNLGNFVDTPKQPDGLNCGVYVCQNTKCILKKANFSICPPDLLSVRKEVMAELALGFHSSWIY